MFQKRIFALIGFVLMTIVSNSQISVYLSNKFWRLKHATINGKEYNFNENNSNAPTLQFSGGNIRGNGGCNAYHTRFTINGTALAINSIMSTRMSCNDLYLDESVYFNALAQSHHLDYSEGSSEFKLTNANNDEFTYFAQFARSSSYTPPARRVVEEYSEVRHHSKKHKAKHGDKLSKKELAREKLLEKKMKKKGGKLSKRELRELKSLQRKTEKEGKSEKRGGKKGKGKKGKQEEKEEKISKKKGKKEKTEKVPKGKKNDKKGKKEKTEKKDKKKKRK